MQPDDGDYPELDALAGGLQSVLRRAGVGRNGLAVVDREPNRLPKTYPSEIVTCRLADGRELRLFCKYQAGSGHPAHGHRRSLAYEAAVYSRVLSRSGVPAPRCYGLHRQRGAGSTWLVMEYVDGRRVMATTAPDAPGGAPVPGAMPLAARWLGLFHGAQDAVHPGGGPAFLITYGAAYYRGWARRTAWFSRRWRTRFPWVAAICLRVAEGAAPLLGAPPTIIHGEFYPGNVLVREGVIYPVDWESAALAAGEIDLAALVEQWPADIVRQCELEYVRARWPEGPPPDLGQRLLAARLYLHLRWLGDRPDWLEHPRIFWRFDDLQDVGRRLGLL
jgi:Phosphotransferase enzyme family